MTRWRLLLAGLGWLLPGALAQAKPLAGDLAPAELSCEDRTNPLGLDEPKPRLSWECRARSAALRGLSQTAYQILVAGSEERLRQNEGDVWDSGVVASDRSIYLEYGGKPLVSHAAYYWKVRIFDQNGRASDWSDSASWVTGLLAPEDWKAEWITWQPAPPPGAPADPHGSVSPWLRKRFDLTAVPTRAFAYVNVAGYEELYVNGQKVGNDRLAPALSDYAARSFYVTYDIAPYLQPGANCIALWLGRGWYDPLAAYPDAARGPGPRARVQCELEVAGKSVSILSDPTWKAAASPYTTLGLYQWNEYHGERYDAALENPAWNLAASDDRGWENARAVRAPSPRAEAQLCPPTRAGQRLAPARVTALGAGRYEIDFGTDLTGGFRFRFPPLPRGKTVTFHYADEKRTEVSDRGTVPEGPRQEATGSYRELVFPDRDGKPAAYQSMRQYDVYVAAGHPGETFATKFNYHGFRYVVIEGLPSAPAREDAEATLLESDLAPAGSFSCSNPLFNRIDAVNRWTLRCLDLGGYLSDCPHRERIGYGDHQVSIETCIMDFSMPAFYRKWMQDWRDAQDPKTGMMPHSAPQRIGGGGPPWSGTLEALAWRQYLYYGDRRALEENYDACRRSADALETHCQNGILRAFGGKWDFIGDWVAPHRGMDSANWAPRSAAECFNNCYRVYLWEQLGRMAAALNRPDEARFCRAKVETIQPLIHAAFYDPAHRRYALDEQVYQVMPLLTGIVPVALRAGVRQTLETNLRAKNSGHLDTGMWGTYFLLQYLEDNGGNDLIYRLMNQTSYPGWGYMLAQGATTFWEQWNGFYSRIHSCFTSPGSWFYQGLAGIRADASAPGFKRMVIAPALAGDLRWVKATHHSPYGWIRSEWKRADGRVTLVVTVPPNTMATIYVPTGDAATVTESGRPIAAGSAVRFIRAGGGAAVYAVGSGDYVFSANATEAVSGDER